MMEPIESPEEITARESVRLSDKNRAKCAKAHAQTSVRESARSRARRKTNRKISDNQTLDALLAIRSGNSTARKEAKKLGVSHTLLNKRIRILLDSPRESVGFHPDATDREIVRAALSVPGSVDRLIEWTGWTRIELLEAVR